MGDVEHRTDGARCRVAHGVDDRGFLTIGDCEGSLMSLDHELRGYQSLGREGQVRLLERAEVRV